MGYTKQLSQLLSHSGTYFSDLLYMVISIPRNIGLYCIKYLFVVHL